MGAFPAAGRTLSDLVGFALAVGLVPGFMIPTGWDLFVCTLLFAVVSVAIRPLVPYVTCSVVLVMLAPALLLVNCGMVWGTVRVARMLGWGVEISGAMPVLLAALVIGAVRLTAALSWRLAWRRYEIYAARAQYEKMDRGRLWYREQLDKRGVAQGASE